MKKRKNLKRRMMLPLIALLMAMTVTPMNSIIANADEGGVALDETNFPDPILREYISHRFDQFDAEGNWNQYGGADGVLSEEELNSVTYIGNAGHTVGGIKTCKGIELLPNLEYFHINTGELTHSKIDFSNNTKLTSIILEGEAPPEMMGNTSYVEGKLKTLDVSCLPDLICLDVRGNELTSLDVSKNKKLIDLEISLNPITKIDVSMLPDLQSLEANGCELTELDVSNNPNLDIDCTQNHLTTLDLSDHISGHLFTSPQNVKGEKKAGEDGTWTVNLKNIVGADNLDKVKVTDGGLYNEKTGIVVYASEPDMVTYEYDYQNSAKDKMLIYDREQHEYTYTNNWEPREEASMQVRVDVSKVASSGTEAKEYTVAFDGNGSSGGAIPSLTQKYHKGDTVTIPEELPTLDGYTFKCWKVNPEFQPGESFILDDTLIAKADDNNVITFKAQWTKKQGAGAQENPSTDKAAATDENSNSYDNTADTGDSVNITLGVILLLMAALGATITIVMKRRQGRI